MRKADWFGKLREALGRKQLQEIGAAMIALRKRPRPDVDPVLVVGSGRQGL